MGAADEQTGYAKLHGKRSETVLNSSGHQETIEEDIDRLITALPARLGRTGGEAPANEKGCFIGLGNVKSISRCHAIIDWDFAAGCYKISCLGKNGLTVDRTQINKDESAALRDESAIRIGVCNFYFQLPQGAEAEGAMDQGEDGVGGAAAMDVDKDTEQTKSAPTTSTPPAPEKKRVLKRTGATYAEMVMQCWHADEHLDKVNEGLTSSEISLWIINRFPEFGEPEKKKQLQNGVQNVLTRRFTKQAPSGEKARGAKWKFDPTKQAPARAKTATAVKPKASTSAPAAVPVTNIEEESLGSAGGSADEDDYMEDEDEEGGENGGAA